jgi:hypothetical protein
MDLGALVGFFDLLFPCKSAKLSYPKGFPMLPSVKKGLIAAGVLVVASVENASAALTAADVDMTAATADMAVVFIAILGVGVIAFGYKQIRKMI